MNLKKPLALAGTALCMQFAHGASVVVNGNADLFNALGVVYEGAAPVAIDVTGLSAITFSVSTGKTVTVNGGGSFNDADGIGSVSGETDTGGNGLSGITTSTAGFIAGAFVGASSSTATMPAALNFVTSGTSFATLAPALQQSFFIGDGLTGDATGAVQTFYVPAGASTLYLGLTDACGYNGSPSCFNDNGGSFTVTTAGTPIAAVPEPETLALMLAGLIGVGFVARRCDSGTRGTR